MNQSDCDDLIKWYQENHRDLPWRRTQDPYKIWISETMLQQTTTTAVLGYFARFLERFDTLEKLAKAPLSNVLELWAGLGYYSRARNLHKAAQQIHNYGRFPQTYLELIKYPGFGPYTSRAVSSLAFGESVGVLDGNVIRVLARKNNLNLEWWRPKVREQLQNQVDDFIKMGTSSVLNQALMELGSQICIPKNPHCKICPWISSCASFKLKNISQRPLKKSRRESEVWIWKARVQIQNHRIRLEKNDYAPFLRGEWFLPGTIIKKKVRPQRYDFRHSITHHDIFVQVADIPVKITGNKKVQSLKKVPIAKSRNKKEETWIKISELDKFVPSSLVKKAIEYAKYNKK
jgi:A/G-specific adenine glycosylase